MENNFNRHLGSKLRMRRLALGLTQTKVAQAINVTFQQIQKYEKGTNGISSLRIMQLANFLKVPVVYFYEDFVSYEGETIVSEKIENLNYSFLAKLFSDLSVEQKEKIFQILKNTSVFEKNLYVFLLPISRQSPLTLRIIPFAVCWFFAEPPP